MNAALASTTSTNSAFRALCSIGFLARFSFALARNPVLPLFAAALGEAFATSSSAATVADIPGEELNPGML